LKTVANLAGFPEFRFTRTRSCHRTPAHLQPPAAGSQQRDFAKHFKKHMSAPAVAQNVRQPPHTPQNTDNSKPTSLEPLASPMVSCILPSQMGMLWML